MSVLMAEFLPYAAGILALVAAYFGIKAKGKSEAKAELQQEQTDEVIQRMEVRNEVEEHVVAAEPTERERLRDKWTRPRPRVSRS